MPHRVAIFAGKFNPPGLHHRDIAERLAEIFDEVRVVPCIPDAAKPEVAEVPAVFRAALCDITFGDLVRVVVDLFDLEADTCTNRRDFEKRFSGSEIWHVVEAAGLTHGTQDSAAIRADWEHSRFVVIIRPGQEADPGKFPPQHRVIPIEKRGSSREIHDLIIHGQDASHLLVPRAHDYIKRYGLYRGTNPAAWSLGSLEGLKSIVHCAPGNASAIAWGRKFAGAANASAADYITVLGGDGTMLRSIRDHWRRRLPFFGVNAGHVGFLMNAPEQVFADELQEHKVIFRQLPLIYVEMERADGATLSTYAFNDAWLERSSSQSAWLSIRVNKVQRIEKLVCDGALVCTAAGSTAYARAMGASPLLADTPAWLVVGSNVMDPPNWKSALLAPDSTVELANLNPEHRSVVAYVDGIEQGPVRTLRARLSRAATAELVFLANRDMAEKIANIQFGG